MKGARALVPYLLLGVVFGIVLTKSEVISWFRIQEMFRFQGIHMFGVLGTALFVATPGIALIKRKRLHARTGGPIEIPPKTLGTGMRYLLGGAIFGMGWALAGACPGPIFALIGNGILGYLVVLVAALLGTWCYGICRHRLPH